MNDEQNQSQGAPEAGDGSQGQATAQDSPAGQLARCTTSICRQCGISFAPKNRNGITPQSCSRKCTVTWHNARRLQATAKLNHKKQRTPRGPSKRAQQVSQTVFMALVPVQERAELLRLAAENLGITDHDRIQAAMRRAQVPNYEGTV